MIVNALKKKKKRNWTPTCLVDQKKKKKYNFSGEHKYRAGNSNNIKFFAR